MNDVAEFVIRRILVAVDASAHSLAALEEAASMAAAMEAELVGLFVEDINLVRLAALPFARQVAYPSGTEERLSIERIDRELKARAELARKAFATVAERRRRPWSFQTVRGRVASEILAAAKQADLILAGKSGGSSTRVGSTALALLAAAPGAFLLVQREVPHAAPIMVLYDGSEISHRALVAGIRLATTRQVSLVVLIPAISGEADNGLRQQVAQRIGSRLVPVRFRRVDFTNLRSFAEAIRTEGGGLLVVPSSFKLGEDPGFQKLLELINNPLLLIR
jgi:nucleotide-binding universal stress UspA family protein